MSYQLPDQLLYSTVNNIFKRMLPIIKHTKVLTIDLSNIKFIDSAGIILLLEMYCLACKYQQQIIYINYPPTISSLLQLYSLDFI